MRALWLIGMMGSGKTAVGSLVAARAGLPMIDTDHRIEARAGSIASIWEGGGEPAFRELESGEVEEIIKADRPCVVATGGGVVLRDENIAAMRASGLVVWLTGGADELAARIVDDGTRPLLEGRPVARRLEELLAERTHAYAAAAHHVVDTSGKAVAQIADEVLELWTGT